MTRKTLKTKIYSFSENNSGGSWWLNREQYDALMKAGWFYEPSDYDKEQGYDTQPFNNDPRDKVPYGWRHHLKGRFNSMKEAVESWEHAVHQDFFAEGCNCCGAPFSMSEEGGGYVSGNTVRRETIRPF